jgi:hypothetical protein
MRAQSLLALTCSLLAASLFASETLRFSQSLTAEQRSSTGLARLNSDQIAALDALVRLDAHKSVATAKKASVAATKTATPSTTETVVAPEPAHVSFSQSLSLDQRRAAGLDTLTAEQQGAVDALVAQRVAPVATTYEPGASVPVEAVEFFPNRYEVHGEVGFSLGVGSGGYSSREAWMTTSLLDTKSGTEFSVGVSSGREKWKGPYRYRDSWDDISFGLSAPLFRSH